MSVFWRVFFRTDLKIILKLLKKIVYVCMFIEIEWLKIRLYEILFV